MALVSSSVKPLAMRSITVAGRLPVRNSVIAVVICAASRPLRRGTGVATPAVAGWQPLQDDAPGGASAAGAMLLTASMTVAANIRMWTMDHLAFPSGGQSRQYAGQAFLRSWFFNGNDRMRLPVAAKIALQSAGATTDTGCSPQPLQKPPLGASTHSTLGISAMRSIR